jgi:PIN domain nuclease of toxin-antitoxin system
MPTVLDTHAWVWWVTSDKRLSRAARQVITRAQNRSELWVSLISLWEVAKKVEKAQMILDRPLDEWLDLAAGQEGLHLAELTRPVLVEACRLPRPFPGDPADQIIVATTRERGAVLVSKDNEIRRYPHVRSLW